MIFTTTPWIHSGSSEPVAFGRKATSAPIAKVILPLEFTSAPLEVLLAVTLLAVATLLPAASALSCLIGVWLLSFGGRLDRPAPRSLRWNGLSISGEGAGESLAPSMSIVEPRFPSRELPP